MNYPDLALSKKQALGNKLQTNLEPSKVDRWLLQQLFKAIGPAPLRMAIKDGPGISPPGTAPVATVRILDRGVLAKMIVDPEVAFGDAYAEGKIEIDGDLPGALTAVYESWRKGASRSAAYVRLTSRWLEWLQDNSRRGSLENIQSHYDLGNDFYKLWLDQRMVYTCAYFPEPSSTLEGAQVAKLDYVCRKLRLQPGERVVEAGCGWGSLALHMAEHYGVSVKAFNISHEQIAYAKDRARERGLSHCVEFIEDDYRNISGKYDVFASVGMVEHVGLSHFADFGRTIHRAIGDCGRGFLHFIGRSYKGEFSRWIRTRIFPGAYAPTLGEAMTILEPHRYAVPDIENLRPHYARTVEHWLDRFEKSSQQVIDTYGPWFQRAWRLYLAGSIAAFRSGSLQLFQISFAGSKNTAGPWTRSHLYATALHQQHE
jgi:cyclopropane-fatty-acyl-phospholipid synthase